MDEYEITDVSELKKETVFLGNHDSTLLDVLNRERFEEDSYCDVTLFVDEVQFHGHRCIIGKLSKMLHAMFKTEMKEKRETVVNLKGLDAATMRLVMDYIYTARVIITTDHVVSLLQASDYLEIDTLKQHCSEFCMQNISLENVLDVQKAAEMYNEPGLATSSATFLSLNKKTIVQQPVFNDLSKDSVDSLLFSEEDRPEREEKIYKNIVRWVKHDVDNRESAFPKLLKKVKLHLLPTLFLDEVVFKEPLICESDLCKTFFASELLKRLKLPPVLRSPDDRKTVCFVVTSRTNITKVDARSLEITRLPLFDHDRSNACFVACNNKLFLIGGPPKRHGIWCLRLNEDDDTWKKVGETRVRRVRSKALYYKGRVMISGGVDGRENEDVKSFSSVEWFDPNQDLVECFNTTDMSKTRQRHSMVQYHDFLVCAGRDNSIEFTTIDAPKWFPGPSLIEEGYNTGVWIRAAVSCGDLYVFDCYGWLSRLQPFNGKWEKLLQFNFSVVQAIADDDTIYALICRVGWPSLCDVWSYNTKTGEQRRRPVGDDFKLQDHCCGFSY